MTDQDFMKLMMRALRNQADNGPMSPAQVRFYADSIELQLNELKDRRVPPSTTIVNESPLQEPVYGVPAGFEINYSPGVEWGRNNPSPYQTFTLTGMPQAPQQTTWRCKHYPSSLENFFDRRHVCDVANCHLTELRWYDNGTCKPQTS